VRYRMHASWLSLALLTAVVAVGGGTAVADLTTAFAGFDTTWGVGVSGLKSSYHTDTRDGVLLPNGLSQLGPERITYPHGVRQVPSPGGSVGRAFDEGVLGVKVDGQNLVVQVAGGLDPNWGYYYSGWGTWYGQGDVFVAVEDSAGISHLALLNSWARGPAGPRTLDGGNFDKAQKFHTAVGASGTSLEGHLVALSSNDDVVRVGGRGSYYPYYSPTPEGLDYRVFAQGGTDKGDATIAHATTTDAGLGGVTQTWFLQTWTVPIAWLSSDPSFTVGLHKTTTCGNDQIGLMTVVPLPSAALLGALGAGMLLWFRRRLGLGSLARPDSPGRTS